MTELESLSVENERKTMQDWLKDKARLYPGRQVLTEGEENYSYQRMDEEADLIMGALEDQVQPGDRVGVLSLNCTREILLAFAVWRLGACLVPFNYRLSNEELKRVIADCNPRLVICDEENQGRVEAITFSELAKKEKEPTVQRYMRSEDIALILYTSGTTGMPKGAMLSHRMILANIQNTIRGWELTDRDRSLLFAPLFHTGGWNVLTLPLLHCGGHLTLMNTFDPAQVVEYIGQGEATVLFGVPTMFEMIMQHWNLTNEEGQKVNFFISGGAPCPHPLVESYLEKGINFRQGFGMTEVGPNCFYFPGEAVRTKMGSVGKPMMGTQVEVIQGEDGMTELAIGGPHVFSGYWNNPEATQATLVDHKVRTGDLAQVDDDGFYTIVGRKKEMFISGGENVFPVEIERELQSHPQVDAAAVIGVEHPKWGEVGSAFVIDKGDSLTPEALKSYLREKLAHYKVPHHFHLVKELPLNNMGKVLKKKLLEWHDERLR